MRCAVLDPAQLVPTDDPRSLWGILGLVRVFMEHHEDSLEPIIVLPSKPGEYYVCSGNHRAAAALICRRHIRAYVIASDSDVAALKEGDVAGCRTCTELKAACEQQVSDLHYRDGGWGEYFRVIAEDGRVDAGEVPSWMRRAVRTVRREIVGASR